MSEINTNLDTTPLPPNNLVAQDPQSAELAGYVRTKTFGRDVRESIARSIELNSTRSKSAEILANETVNVANDLTERFNAQIGALTEDSEVIDARGGKTTLGQRLDETDVQLAHVGKAKESFVYVTDYYNPSHEDWTLAIQSALDNADGREVIFPPRSIHTKEVKITKSCVLNGNQCTIKGVSTDRIFTVDNELDYLEVKNFEVDFPEEIGGVNVFFLTVYHNVPVCEVHHNWLGFSRVSLRSDDGENSTVPNVHTNEWRSDELRYSNNNYLEVFLGGHSVKKFGGWIEKNTFDVYGRTGSNVDLIKLSGGASMLTFSSNYVRNKNKSSDAEIDTFTGADKMRFVDNHLVNVSVKRQQMKGVLTQVNENSHDLISGNTLEFEDGAAQNWAFLLKGSLFSVFQNSVVSHNKTKALRAFYLQASDVIFDSFNTHNPVRFNIGFNTVDFRDANSESTMLYYSTSSSENTDTSIYGSITGNTLLGGRFSDAERMKKLSLIGNTWSDIPDGAPDIKLAYDSIAMGNIVEDNKVAIDRAMTQGNLASIKPLLRNSSSIGMLSPYREIHVVSGGGGISSIDEGGRYGSILTILSEGVFTIYNLNNIQLKNSQNYVMKKGDVLRLICVGEIWKEISRTEV